MNGRFASGMSPSVVALALLVSGCGVRTPLRPTDALIDDDPWLKTDAGRDARRSPGDGGADAARSASPGAVRAVHEVAKALWDGDPDAGHLQLAQAGQLRTSSELETVVREMLKDPRAAQGVGHLFTPCMSAREAWECIVTRWVRHLRGSLPAGDDPLISRARSTFERSGGDLREVIVTVLGATPL